MQVLSVNAAKDATELVAKLRAYHHSAQTKADKKHLSRYLLTSNSIYIVSFVFVFFLASGLFVEFIFVMSLYL